ncbi:MAG: prepilin-type N-terminal cleavage/methylation domain-containing protein [Alphaproteobacteria bacterium]|nr:prepilin-type N-terminal cleavage/methylation domain-containing protein [Alphaproteobacteria bacterium]
MQTRTCIRNLQNGFSLVEMAIVLTIIALLAGGILTGKSLIRSSEVQATISKVSEYRSAINNFSERYMALPGDFSTATSFWADAYDGDGDGVIGNSYDTSCASDFDEQWAAFQHLGKAELIDGEYEVSGGDVPNPGVNVPRTPIAGGGYTIRSCGDITSSIYYFVGYYGHVIQVGGLLNWAKGGTRNPMFTPDEAGAIDKKLDDSLPGTGIIKAPKASDTYATACTTTDNPATADYNFADSQRLCPLFFLLGF